MPRYKVTFSRLVPESRSVIYEDELDELDEDEIVDNAWFLLRDYLEANNIEQSGWGDSEIDLIE